MTVPFGFSTLPPLDDPLIGRFFEQFGRAPMSEQELQAFHLGSSQIPGPPSAQAMQGGGFQAQPPNGFPPFDPMRGYQAPGPSANPPLSFPGPAPQPGRMVLPWEPPGGLGGTSVVPPFGHLGGQTPEEVLAELGGSGGTPPPEPERHRLGGVGAIPVPPSSIGGGGAAGRGSGALPGMPAQGVGGALLNINLEEERMRLAEQDAKRQAVVGLLSSLIGGVGGGLLGGV